MRIEPIRTGAVVLSLLLSPSLCADTITLNNGHVIQADRSWVDGAQLYYEKAGGVFGIPRRLVQSVGAVATPSASPSGTRGAQFRLRYDGGVNEPLGVAVLQALSAAYAEYSKRLGAEPRDAVSVVLMSEAELREAGAPGWAEGLYDGTVRIPAKGIEKLTPRVHAVLRHELAHSFVTARTGGNCPTWVQEGVAQWLEGGDPARADASLASRARSGTLLPLVTLEAPFQNLVASDVPLAYAESLSVVGQVLRSRGEAGLVRLLAALGDGLPSEEALPVALGLSYAELQKSWEVQLKGS